MKIIEEKRELEIKDSYDVLVAGGGIAGVSAALAAARNGAKVILVEKLCVVGGLATAGLVAFYLAICDGQGNKICHGIAEELLHLCMKYGKKGPMYPTAWVNNGTKEEKSKNRLEAQFNPQVFALEMEKLLLDAGVYILYDTTVCGVSKSDNKIDAVIVENRTGRYAYAVKSAIDATGDALLCTIAEAPTTTYSKLNSLAAWSYGYANGKVKIVQLGVSDSLGDQVEKISDKKFTGLDGEEVSEMVQMAHSRILNQYVKKYNEDNEYETVTLPAMPQLRMTRRIDGEYTLDENEAHKYFEDSIGLIPDWRKRGPVWEIPFRSLYSAKIPNLLCAGRIISVTDDMWDASRVIPPCAVTGEAAGIAASISDDFTNISIEKLQRTLRDKGVIIHEKEL